MDNSIYDADHQRFLETIAYFKNLPYATLSSYPHISQLPIEGLSPYTTIECVKTCSDDDEAITIILTKYHWIDPKDTDLNLDYLILIPTDELEHTVVPLPNSNINMVYSRHCMSRYFFKTPDEHITEDIFDRNCHAENVINEAADWFGKTGLPESVERNISRFLREQYGEYILDEDSIRANHLTYLGEFILDDKLFLALELVYAKKNPQTIHAWKYTDHHYAFVYKDPSGSYQFDFGSFFPKAE